MNNLFLLKIKHRQQFITLVMTLLLCFSTASVLASDHADPINLKNPEAGIAGLFVFPDDDQLILILTLRPGLATKPPYDLESYTYTIHMDLNSPLAFDDEEDKARYGGTIVKPEGIHSNVSIQFTLNNNVTIAKKSIIGLSQRKEIKMSVAVRDDPFIFPRFFGTNVIGMTISIPFSYFPKNQKNWILWATSDKDGEQVDHVGRSNRTMEPRMDLLNTLHPSEHVKTINEYHNNPTVIQDVAKTFISPLFAVRQYDFFPDVMIFTTRYPSGFPNGRRLTDDVAGLTCAQGNCLLMTTALGTSKTWPRQTVNDKEFLNQFPYLAEPWSNPTAPTDAKLQENNKIKLIIIGIIVLLLWLLPWWLFYRCFRVYGI